MKLLLVVLAFCALAFAAWPADPVTSCSDALVDRSEVIAPSLISHTIENGDGNTTSIEGYDRLSLTFKSHASYAIHKIFGDDDTFVPNTNAEDTAEHKWKVEYAYNDPADACYGQVTLQIWLGLLEEWGFGQAKDPVTGNWVLNGSLWVNISRPIWLDEDNEVADWQIATVSFPITINVVTTLKIDMDTPITVYGTSRVTGSIILFQEHNFPSQRVTVYYLFSVQFPYKFVNVTGFPAFNAPTGIAVQDGASLEYYFDSASQMHCPASVLTTSAGWCYQLVKVDYVVSKPCDAVSAPDLTFTGQYAVDLKIGCRDGITWCSIPSEDWTKHHLTFRMTSNNICERFLTYTETGINGHLEVFGADKSANAWDESLQQTSFVPDNNVWFVVKLQASATFSFEMTQLKVLNITFGKEGSEETVFDGTTWPVASALDPDLTCNSNPAATCFLGKYPTAWWRVLLNHTYYALTAKTPYTLRCWAYVELSYKFAEKRVVLLETRGTSFPLGADTFVNTGFIDGSIAATPVAAATGSVVGVAVGVSVACALLIAAVVVVVIVRRSKRQGATKLQEETNQS